jgi:hypothetical protein
LIVDILDEKSGIYEDEISSEVCLKCDSQQMQQTGIKRSRLERGVDG